MTGLLAAVALALLAVAALLGLWRAVAAGDCPPRWRSRRRQQPPRGGISPYGSPDVGEYGTGSDRASLAASCGATAASSLLGSCLAKSSSLLLPLLRAFC